ncbi:MAG: aspartate aminotransferase family protein [Gemmatimonadales bacterium]
MPTPSEDALARLLARTPKSQAAQEEGARHLALEVVPTFSMPTPLYVELASGSRVVDIDGNEYLDLAMGFGPHLLGHRPPAVEAAVREALGRAWQTAMLNTTQHELARLLKATSPSAELVVFCNTGTEATMYGMRVARAFTGKPAVAVFEGAYHGAHDYALIMDDPKSERTEPASRAIGKGIPDVIGDVTVRVLPYRHEAAFDLIRRHAGELAAVVVQPVQNVTPRADNGEFLRALRTVCDESGVLLMFDEIVTGFRLALGGGQEYFGVVPDLATHGKALGGGLPIGALSGRADVMSLLSRGGTKDGVFSGGTFSGNPLSMAAGVAAVTHLRDHQAQIYPYLHEQSARLAAAVNGFCQAEQIPAMLMSAESIFCMQFTEGPIESARDLHPVNRAAERAFYLHLLDQGVLVPGVHVFFLSSAHTPDEVDRIIAAFVHSLGQLRAEGLC